MIDLDRLERGPFQVAPTMEAAPAGGGGDPRGVPCVVAAAARIEAEATSVRSLTFRASGPAGTAAAIRVRVPSAPLSVTANGSVLAVTWDAGSGTALLRHANTPEGVSFVVRW